MRKNKRVRGKNQEKTTISQYMMAIGALIVIVLSVSNNVVYWTEQAHSQLSFMQNVMFWEFGFDYDFWSYGLVSIATDLAKPALVMLIPVFIAARSYKMASVLSICLLASISLSLGAAWGIRAEKQADITAQAQKIKDQRQDVHNAYISAQSGAYLNIAYTPVATLKIDLAQAKKEVSPKIWQRTSSCVDATKKSSINSCNTVNALRKEMKRSQKIEIANQKWELASKKYNTLPPVVKSVTSQNFKDYMNIAIALFIEIFSTIGLYAAFERPTRKVEKPQVELVQEVKWLSDMKKAAKNPAMEKIYFDEDGLLKAPYATLTDVFDVKSISSVKSRLDVLAEAGKLQKVGTGRNMKYKVLENA